MALTAHLEMTVCRSSLDGSHTQTHTHAHTPLLHAAHILRCRMLQPSRLPCPSPEDEEEPGRKSPDVSDVTLPLMYEGERERERESM